MLLGEIDIKRIKIYSLILKLGKGIGNIVMYVGESREASLKRGCLRKFLKEGGRKPRSRMKGKDSRSRKKSVPRHRDASVPGKLKDSKKPCGAGSE